MGHKVYVVKRIFSCLGDTCVNNDKASCWAKIIKLKNCLQMQVLSTVTENNLRFHKPNIFKNCIANNFYKWYYTVLEVPT